VWARPLALFSYFAIGAPPGYVRPTWARTRRPLFGACFAGSVARRILRFQPPSFVTDEVCRHLRHNKNCSATNVEIQEGNGPAYGDETADGAYGTNSRPSHGCETIPSTMGAMPASKGPKGSCGALPPPIEI
jgi:hypothetical protein